MAPNSSSIDETPVDPRETERILAALEVRDPQQPSTSEAAAREYVELVGTLGLQVAADPAPAAVKDKLFIRLGLEAAPPSNVVSLRDPDAAREATSHAPLRRPVVAFPRWAVAAAALLAFGLAAFSGFLFSELRRERSLVEGLLGELQLAKVASVEGPQREVKALQAGFEMVTSPGTRMCKLDSRDPQQPEAVAAMFLQPDRGRWFLDARNLKRCPLGRLYQVWFLTAEGPVRAGAFQIKDDSPAFLGANDLPLGTRAVMVTLEYSEEVGAEPGGAMVLFGDQARELL